MKILIYGTGGVGGYFGGKLAQAGHDVTFIARGEHLKAIRRAGLRVLSPSGNFTIKNAKATDQTDGLDVMDLIILGIKSWQVRDAVECITGVVGPKTIILPLQNGVFANQEILEVMDRSNLVGGLCKIISRIEEPGVINHMMFNPEITIGELDNQQSTRVKDLQHLFEQAGIHATIASNIDAALWKKFMFICTSGLGALTRSSYGVMREMEGTRKLLISQISEIYELGRHLNITLENNVVEKTMEIVDSLPYEATSSLQRDVIEGRPSELDYLAGAVVKIGRENGFETPVNSFIYNSLLPIERENRKNAN